jgi:Fur family ferric uptake transcriptional regulator
MDRQTVSRETVIRLFRTNARPLSMADINRLVGAARPGTAYSTVFRIVRKLEAAGLVVRVDWRERGSRYEWAKLPHHHHAVCVVCGSVADLDDADVGFNPDTVLRRTGFSVRHHAIELEGICSGCAASERESHA